MQSGRGRGGNMEMEKEGRSGQTEGQRTDGRVQDGANVLVWGAEGRRGRVGRPPQGARVSGR